MPHMRRAILTAIFSLSAALASGCGALQRPSPLRPPPHPLLEAVPFPQTRYAHARARRPRPAARPAAEPPRPSRDFSPKGSADLSSLSALEGHRVVGGRPASDQALIEVAYGDDAPSPTAIGRPLIRGEAPKPGDVVLFAGDGYGPRSGVLMQVDRDGQYEVMFVTRGAVRRIYLDPRRPHTRRVGDDIRNSFIRPLRRGRAHDNRVLAGQLLAGFRRVED